LKKNLPVETKGSNCIYHGKRFEPLSEGDQKAITGELVLF